MNVSLTVSWLLTPLSAWSVFQYSSDPICQRWRSGPGTVGEVMDAIFHSHGTSEEFQPWKPRFKYSNTQKFYVHQSLAPLFAFILFSNVSSPSLLIHEFVFWHTRQREYWSCVQQLEIYSMRKETKHSHSSQRPNISAHWSSRKMPPYKTLWNWPWKEYKYIKREWLD